jgi:hypothetical protein
MGWDITRATPNQFTPTAGGIFSEGWMMLVYFREPLVHRIINSMKNLFTQDLATGTVGKKV